LQIQEKILEELPYVKITKTKKLGLIPSLRVTLNPGYEEFFGPLIEAYGEDKVYFALKELEKEASDSFKLRVKALRKEFEKRRNFQKEKVEFNSCRYTCCQFGNICFLSL